MSDINTCAFTGRLGADPEIKTFPSGERIANMRIAVGSKWKDKSSGNTKEWTEWIALVVRGGLVGVVEKYLAKGSRIAVSGQLRVRQYDDKHGEKRTATELYVRDLTMLDSRGDGQGRTQAQASGAREYAEATGGRARSAAPVSDYDDSDDLPF